MKKKKVKSVAAFSRKDFRKWLEKNHETENKVAVIIYKKHTGKPFPSHRELIEEAICFGWIDTTIKRIDEDKFLRNFAKRNKNSKWSDNTLSYAKDLIKRGLMTSTGLKYYDEGLSRPTHDHGIPKNPAMSKELEEELKKNKAAWKNFNDFPPSAKRTFYRWLLRIKGEETRKKRIKQIVAMSLNKEKISANTRVNQ
ncbi:YdeI/OmpD-associated family protein [Candidatus Woesearchaeota archaeon]|nr:YdeI/OmpD-associated family protein [Candidatus Woesearchaeota archaeon]